MKIIDYFLKIIFFFLFLYYKYLIVFSYKCFFKYNNLNISNNVSQRTLKFNNKYNALQFLQKCVNNTLKDQILLSYNYIIIPKISIIIPLHNCQLTIETTIKSIQYQNLYKFEIILVNDFSSDNTSIVIKNMQKEDKRIKFINNKKNMGILYSRCIGALKSKGNYIFVLDNDDLFSDHKILKTIFIKAKKNNFDIVEFKAFDISSYNPDINDFKDDYFNHHQKNIILHQPELGLFPISKKNKYYPNNYHLWGKCFLSRIYKKAVNSLGIKRFSIYNCWTEDISILIIIFNLAESYIFLDIYGIFHLISRNTTTFKLPKVQLLFSNIYLLDILIDFLKNDEKSKIYAVYKALKFKQNELITNKKASSYFKEVLKKLLDCKFINKKDKMKLLKKFKFMFN